MGIKTLQNKIGVAGVILATISIIANIIICTSGFTQTIMANFAYCSICLVFFLTSIGREHVGKKSIQIIAIIIAAFFATVNGSPMWGMLIAVLAVTLSFGYDFYSDHAKSKTAITIASLLIGFFVALQEPLQVKITQSIVYTIAVSIFLYVLQSILCVKIEPERSKEAKMESIIIQQRELLREWIRVSENLEKGCKDERRSGAGNTQGKN